MAAATKPLKAPFPWFGGKSRVAHLVWDRFGDCDNIIEPFFGSGAFLLRRPHAPRIETINDADCYVANFWRATQLDPEQVAAFADSPVNEADLHARHRWLVLSDEARQFRARMRTEPDYYDAKIAGWWCWGICCWIGGGWCTTNTDGEGEGKLFSRGENQSPCNAGSVRGVHGSKNLDNRKPRIDGGEWQTGHGVHAKGERPWEWNQTPLLSLTGNGVSSDLAAGRPQLADAYDIGRGVNSNGELGTCAQRRAWLVDWFGRLRDRLRLVRVCCGDWSRVCSSESTTTRLGTTGVFLDPPYSSEAGRDMNLYSTDCGDVAHEVRKWCLEYGPKKAMRIALCGYAGEGHEELESHGWECVAWKASGGYGNRTAKGKENAGKERIWYSPHCLKPDGMLFT